MAYLSVCGTKPSCLHKPAPAITKSLITRRDAKSSCYKWISTCFSELLTNIGSYFGLVSQGSLLLQACPHVSCQIKIKHLSLSCRRIHPHPSTSIHNTNTSDKMNQNTAICSFFWLPKRIQINLDLHLLLYMGGNSRKKNNEIPCIGLNNFFCSFFFFLFFFFGQGGFVQVL